MANENDIQEGIEDQPSQDDAGTGTSDDSTVEGGNAPAGQEDDTDYKAEVEKLQKSNKELQSQFTTVSQEAARSQQLLETLQPFIDYSRMGGQTAPSPGEAEQDEDDDMPLTRKQVREMMDNMSKQVRGEIIAQTVRSKYPDVCDNNWKELIVRGELAKVAKTHPYETPEQRIERAVKKTRDILEGERQAGKAAAEEQHKKAEQEARQKAATAARASGLETTGTTSPKQSEDETKPVSADEYVQGRQRQRLAREAL